MSKLARNHRHMLEESHALAPCCQSKSTLSKSVLVTQQTASQILLVSMLAHIAHPIKNVSCKRAIGREADLIVDHTMDSTLNHSLKKCSQSYSLTIRVYHLLHVVACIALTFLIAGICVESKENSLYQIVIAVVLSLFNQVLLLLLNSCMLGECKYGLFCELKVASTYQIFNENTFVQLSCPEAQERVFCVHFAIVDHYF